MTCTVCGFSPILPLVFGFRQQRWRFFGLFCPVHFTVYAWDTTPRSLAKTGAIPLDHSYSVLPFRGMDYKPSLCTSYYLGRNGKAQDYIKSKTISQISPDWENILWTLILDFLVPRPQYYASVIRFGSRGPGRKVWPRQNSEK